MTLLRSSSLRRTPHARRWTCAHCRVKNEPAKRKCGSCGIGRTTKRRSLSARCDSMWAQIVKARGECAIRWQPAFDVGAALFVPCAGPLEAAHVVPRRHRSVRWDLLNGRALCHAHHYYFTNHEKAWRDFIGPEWDRLWVKAQTLWDKSFPIAELSVALRVAREAA